MLIRNNNGTLIEVINNSHSQSANSADTNSHSANTNSQYNQIYMIKKQKHNMNNTNMNNTNMNNTNMNNTNMNNTNTTKRSTEFNKSGVFQHIYFILKNSE
jgi:Set1/Ash2 histone methyltransferase complex subunit ASH2